MTNEVCNYNETLYTYNVISYKVGDKILGFTADKFTIQIVNGRMNLINNDGNITDIGTLLYSAQPLINFDMIKTKCKINQTAEKINTEVTLIHNNKSIKSNLKSNFIFIVINNKLKIKENIVLIDNAPKFISSDTNILTSEGYDYCFSMASTVDKSGMDQCYSQ
jgi:hypothetical protein